MIKITFERSGGLMGRKTSLSLNLDELPPDQTGTLRQLLDQADFFNLPQGPASRAAPDEFMYTITVETETQRHTVHTSDTQAADALRPFLNELSQLARSRKT